MCAPGCLEHLGNKLTRRGWLTAIGGAAAAVALPPASADARPFRKPPRKVFDLTHTLSPEFPTFFGVPGISLKKTKDFKKDGFNLNEWTLIEHAGTHIDAPLHFSESGNSADAIPVEQLMVPLAVVDVTSKASTNADYQLTPDDIRAWEKKNGPLPNRCCVAMYSGWEKHVTGAKFVGKDGAGVFHFPGVHPEATALLLKERTVTGLAVDTLSLDYGPSKNFRTHTAWLPAGRWGLENVAGLGNLPAKGAMLFVGAPKIKGATGGPARVMALV